MSATDRENIAVMTIILLLLLANNWALAATYNDVGIQGNNNIPLTWKCHKDVCRVDGFQGIDFTLISDRAIV
ncbi:MAG: hypothetical protein WAM14_04615 [Candidatus Nitrosopolaris sp.]